MSKYRSEWKAFSKNEEFWNEVLVGRKIEKVTFFDDGTAIKSFTLDSGEEVFLTHGKVNSVTTTATLMVVD